MSKAKSAGSEPEAFQEALLSWYRSARRKLPWREHPSLYKTVVSEFMLQQTQVKTVLPYFDRWLRALPNFASLAAASEEQVLKLWEGLGYYSRARNLQKLAREYCALAPKPRTPDEWIRLPGVGPYSAAAITSIAFGEPVACVDGNVVRILARLEADDRSYKDGATAAKAFTAAANERVNRRHPGDHNQAMMELGATLCTRHAPQCLLCPVSRWCRAASAGNPEDFPKLAAKQIERKTIIRALCVHKARILLHCGSASARRLANILELPSSEQLGPLGEILMSAPFLLRKRRGITRFQITENFHYLDKAPIPLPAGLQWVDLARIDEVVLSGPHRKWLPELIKSINLA